MMHIYRLATALTLLVITRPFAIAQQLTNIDSSSYYQGVRTYVNPVLPGDHPDPTLLKVGDDFYHCGSTFHFNPYLPVYHSKDLIHWDIISRVLPVSKAAWVSDRPSGGIWQGAITYFYGSYWIYFSAGVQWFCKASSPAGPWSDPVEVKSNSTTGNLGYDNSIFVDDDGKPYMVIKNGQKVNRLQALSRDGQLADTVINLDWVNAKLQYSWAEGPVMCRRNGYYYYFPAGDVSGGQYVLRGTALTSDSTKWERLGNFFKPITDAKVGFRRPNHISAPFKLSDGTWWTIGQSYEKYDADDWSGMGRQTGLYQVVWEGDRPWGVAPTTQPVLKPDLPETDMPWRSVKSDQFSGNKLELWWHFLNKKASARFSLTDRKGWIRLTPDTNRTHLMQKETDHFYTAVTKVDLDAVTGADKGGIYLTNGNQTVTVRLYTGYNGGKQIVFDLDSTIQTIPNRFGNTVWLKLERSAHVLKAFCSGNGKQWTPVGKPVSAVNLDKAQPNFNSWVGTSVGLFAEGKPADFDFFICKDGLSVLPVAGYSNYYGIEKVTKQAGSYVTNTSDYGGWLMLSGVDLGNSPTSVELVATASGSGNIEIWLDDLKRGKLIAKIPVSSAAKPKAFKTTVSGIKGQHDVFIKFPSAAARRLYLSSIKFYENN